MYILHRRIYASNDVILRMWLVAAAIILAVTVFLMWSDRFRENVDTSIASVSVFGVEAEGREAANFTGTRGFFKKMNKLGLPASTRNAELKVLFEQLEETGTLVSLPNPPVLWVYAEGLTKEDRDRCVQTYGKVFFEKSKFCFSVIDARGFAIQLDPDTFRVLWAKDGGAVCALPLLSLPDDTGTHGFTFRVEERLPDGVSWKNCGEIKIPAFPLPSMDEAAVAALAAPVENYSAVAEISPESEIDPPSIAIESLVVPRDCRFFSSSPADRAAFGTLSVRIGENKSGKVPAVAWSLENFGLFSPADAPTQEFPITRADALHKNVRFLENEIFENNADGVLRVPVAKTLFPSADARGNARPWLVQMRFVRSVFFPEDFHAFPPLRIGKNDSVLAEPISTENATAKVRAFRVPDYFRVRSKKIPAVVLEISQELGVGDDFYWVPYRVKTDAGEELFPESTVNVKPGVKQYWFLPRRSAPAKIEVVYAVTRSVFCEAEIAPTVAAE